MVAIRRCGPRRCSLDDYLRRALVFVVSALTVSVATLAHGMRVAWIRSRDKPFRFYGLTARTADSSSMKALSFSSARTTKLFASSRCASATNIVRPWESTAETQPQLQPALLRLSARILIRVYGQRHPALVDMFSHRSYKVSPPTGPWRLVGEPTVLCRGR